MKTARLVCPHCSASDYEPAQLDYNRCRCRRCGQHFDVREAKQLPQSGASRSSSAGMGVALIAFAATGVLMAAGVVAFIVTKRPSRPRHVSTYEKPRPVEVTPVEVTSAPVEPEQLPSAEVRSVRHAEQTGYEVWVGEVVNTGEVPIDRPCVRAVLKDAGGNVLGDQRAYVPRAALAKGETGPFRITAKKSAYSTFEVVLCELRRLTYASHEAPAKVVEEKHVRGDYGSSTVVGTVENNQRVPLQYVQVVVMGRDAGGALVSVDEGYAEVKELAPGQRSAFKVMVGIFSTGTVARYEAFAVGMPK